MYICDRVPTCLYIMYLYICLKNKYMYTVFQKRSPFLFCCSFYKQWPIFVIFGTQYICCDNAWSNLEFLTFWPWHLTLRRFRIFSIQAISCNTAVTDLPTSPAYCCYTTLGKYESYDNDFICGCTCWKIFSFSMQLLSIRAQILQWPSVSFTQAELEVITPEQ